MKLIISNAKGLQTIFLCLMVLILGACNGMDEPLLGSVKAPERATCQYYLCINTESITARSITVDGIIRAEEILVETVGADYVFSPSYDLKSLEVVEGFINEHRHLPGIPSSALVEAAGGKIAIGDSYRALLEKIEELTLYTIDQDKRIAELEKLLISQYEIKGSSPAGH